MNCFRKAFLRKTQFAGMAYPRLRTNFTGETENEMETGIAQTER